jgi:predicted DNA-binding transcriptional regulator AlpA
MKQTPLAPGRESLRVADPLSLRPKEAAQMLGISERLLWEWTRGEGVPHVRIGNVVLYPVDGVRRWLVDRSIALTSQQEEST